MKWENTCFAYKETAEQCKIDLVNADIKTGNIIVEADGMRIRYYVPWMAIGKEQYETALKIVCSHLD